MFQKVEREKYYSVELLYFSRLMPHAQVFSTQKDSVFSVGE